MAQAGAIHHVMARGNNREAIFRDDNDRCRFLGMAGRMMAKRRWSCASYCLLGNHVHLLVSTIDDSLSAGMRDLLAAHARAFNDRHGRRGHLFRERFLSIPVSDERQFAAVVRYIALNPVEAGLCRDPRDWPWSSLAPALGLAPAQPFLDVAWLLETFGETTAGARRNLAELVSGDAPDEPPGTVAEDVIPVPARARNVVRPTVCDLLRRHGEAQGLGVCVDLGYTHAEIGRALGVSRSAVSQRIRRGEGRR